MLCTYRFLVIKYAFSNILLIRVILCSVINLIDYQLEYELDSTRSSIISILGSPSLLCLLGSRMFINLKEAGSSDVKSGSSTSALSQQSGSSVVSDLQFADVTGSMNSGKYCPTSIFRFTYLTLGR